MYINLLTYFLGNVEEANPNNKLRESHSNLLEAKQLLQTLKTVFFLRN